LNATMVEIRQRTRKNPRVPADGDDTTRSGERKHQKFGCVTFKKKNSESGWATRLEELDRTTGE